MALVAALWSRSSPRCVTVDRPGTSVVRFERRRSRGPGDSGRRPAGPRVVAGRIGASRTSRTNGVRNRRALRACPSASFAASALAGYRRRRRRPFFSPDGQWLGYVVGGSSPEDGRDRRTGPAGLRHDGFGTGRRCVEPSDGSILVSSPSGERRFGRRASGGEVRADRHAGCVARRTHRGLESLPGGTANSLHAPRRRCQASQAPHRRPRPEDGRIADDHFAAARTPRYVEPGFICLRPRRTPSWQRRSILDASRSCAASRFQSSRA